jgi:hypothetical protein
LRRGRPTHAIESKPALRAIATGNVVNYDDIIDALQSLDARQSADTVTYTFKRRHDAEGGATGKRVDATGRTTAT